LWLENFSGKMFELNKTCDISMSDFEELIYKDVKLVFSNDAIDVVSGNFKFLKKYASNKIIYGINTGLGPMAQYKIDDDKRLELQYNLIRSHAAGAGNPIDDESVLASLIVRAKCFCNGYSGVHPSVIKTLVNLFNHRIIPFIPEHGGVGASGDLVQLSHLALNLIGEGKVKYQGEWRNTSEVFNKEDIKPIEVHIREGLALINGTSVMTGTGIVNLLMGRKLVNWSLSASILLNEIVSTFDDHYSETLNSLKGHSGQIEIARVMRETLESSKLTSSRHSKLYSNSNNGSFKIDKKVQEYYSLRCVPQILGPIFETLLQSEKILIEEANSVSDNPIIDEESEFVYHGGNFHGDYVSFEMDKLKIAITKLSMLAERQLNFVVNHRINKILPPFVNLGTLGLNLGMQGAQFTAVSTTAENQALSTSMYIHSIPNNNDNQDIVSMGTNSALMCRRVIDNTFQVLAIEFMSLLQAVDYLEIADKLSDNSSKIYKNIRAIFPKFTEDYPVYTDIEKVISYLKTNKLNII
jgi:histidine ammonia-lyase